MKRDLKSHVDVVQSIAPGAKTATVNGAGVDTQQVEAAMMVLSVGTWTDGTHTPKMQDSPDNSTWTDTPAVDQQGTFTAITSAGQANAVQRVGYIGSRRYVRAVVTVAGATTGAVYGANFDRAVGHVEPLP